MSTLEVFFDYTCPYCLRGHNYLIELLPSYPQLEIVWRPCEAHPRPERYGRHSDLCIQGMFYALDHGLDIWAYHDRMYAAAQKDRIDIENLDALANAVRDLLVPEDFRKSIRSGEYVQIQLDSNKYAYEHSGVWALPSYRMNGGKLDSVEGVGVTKNQLGLFMDSDICGGD